MTRETLYGVPMQFKTIFLTCRIQTCRSTSYIVALKCVVLKYRLKFQTKIYFDKKYTVYLEF